MRIMKTIRYTRWMFLGLAALMLTGCLSDDPAVGYTGRDMYRRGIRTVAVPIWTRSQKVYRRDLEFQLTEALVKRIELDTPYKVTTKDKADTIITGRIENINQMVLSFNPDTGNPREIQITFTVSFTWKDLRTGNMLVKEDSFVFADVFVPTNPYNEDFFMGAVSLIDRMARQIVETMEADWGDT